MMSNLYISDDGYLCLSMPVRTGPLFQASTFVVVGIIHDAPAEGRLISVDETDKFMLIKIDNEI